MITLLTDFGNSDAYVGIMKGAILSVDPSAVIVDLTHDIAPQDIAGAAYCIDSAYKYFPPGSIHVVVVDPGVGSHRAIIAVSAGGHVFLAPDNGVLSRILSSGQPKTITVVENDTYFRKPVSQTFHGRDIFAPVAGHLNNGLPVDRLGPEVTADQLMHLDLPKPYVSKSREIKGQVIRIDRFGNLITNIDHQLIRAAFDAVNAHELNVSIGAHHISGLSASYQEAGSQSLLALIGSTGFMEIAVSGGRASEFCGAGQGAIVLIQPAGK